MDNLPPEILSDIFRECLSSGLPTRYRPETFTRIETFLIPLRVSHVCRRWRGLALSYGELWSHLSLKYNGGRQYQWPRKRQTMLEVFDTWLQRSYDAPLNFAVWCSTGHGKDKDEDTRVCEHVVTTLLANQCRWKDVCFKWEGLKPSRNLPDGIINAIDMPLLTALALDIEDIFGGLDEEGVRSYINISRSPLLQRLIVRGLNTIEVGEEPIHSLVGPIDIRVMHDSVDADRDALRCRELLKVAPNLRHFHVDFRHIMGGGLTAPYEPRTLVLRDLKSLKLTALSLNKLVLPSLEALMYAHDDPSGGETLYHFIEHSVPPLTYLKLFGSCANEETLIPALHLLPSLRYLSIEHASISARVFRELTIADTANAAVGQVVVNESVICPELRYLSLTQVIDERGTMFVDALVVMLTSRWNAFGLFEEGICVDEGHRCLYLPLSEEEYEELSYDVQAQACTLYAASDRSFPNPFGTYY